MPHERQVGAQNIRTGIEILTVGLKATIEYSFRVAFARQNDRSNVRVMQPCEERLDIFERGRGRRRTAKQVAGYQYRIDPMFDREIADALEEIRKVRAEREREPDQGDRHQLAQAGGVLMLNGTENPGNKLVFFMAINNVKFRKPVVPGDQLILEAENIRAKARTGHVRCRALVGDQVAAEAEIKFMLVDNELGG